MKIQKSLWYHELTSEILVKNFGPNIRVPALFSREEIEKHWNPKDLENLKHIKPLESTTVWIEEATHDG